MRCQGRSGGVGEGMEEEGWCNTGYESKTFRWFRGEVTVHKNKSKNYYKYVTQTIIKF